MTVAASTNYRSLDDMHDSKSESPTSHTPRLQRGSLQVSEKSLDGEEGDDDDGHGMPPAGQASNFQAGMNFFKAFVGAGILALPHAFAKSGIILSLFLMLLLALAARYCIMLLLHAAHELRHAAEYRGQSSKHVAQSFSSVAGAAFGVWGVRIAMFGLVSSQLGFCIAYVSFVSKNMHGMVPYFSQIQWMLLFGALMALAVQIRDVKHLSFATFLGNVVYAFSMATVFYFGFSRRLDEGESQMGDLKPGGLPFTFGTACFALEGIGLVLPVERSLRARDQFSKITSRVIGSVTLLYLSFGALGVLFYGNAVSSTITLNLPEHEAVTVVVKISLCVALCFTYIIQMFPVTGICDRQLSKFLARHTKSQPHTRISDEDDEMEQGQPRQVAQSSLFMRVLVGGGSSLIRCCLVLFTVLVTIVLGHNFGLVVSLVGSLSNSLIAFILPCLFYLKVCRPQQTLHRVLPWIIVVVGAAAAIAGIQNAIREFVAQHTS